MIESQEAVCFVSRSQALELPASTRREARELKLLGGEAADALYFTHQRDLQALRQSGVNLAESDVKPTDRYLMERFVRAGFETTGIVEEKDGVRTMRNPHLRAAEVQPALKALSLDIETRGNTDQLYSVAGAAMRSGEGTREACVFMIGEAEDEPRAAYDLRYFHDERSLLIAFFQWLGEVDPDLIIGWSVVGFDLNFLERNAVPWDWRSPWAAAVSRRPFCNRARLASLALPGFRVAACSTALRCCGQASGRLTASHWTMWPMNCSAKASSSPPNRIRWRRSTASSATTSPCWPITTCATAPW